MLKPKSTVFQKGCCGDSNCGKRCGATRLQRWNSYRKVYAFDVGLVGASSKSWQGKSCATAFQCSIQVAESNPQKTEVSDRGQMCQWTNESRGENWIVLFWVKIRSYVFRSEEVHPENHKNCQSYAHRLLDYPPICFDF